MDVTGISPGADFTRVIQERVGACSALVAVIGKEWLTMADEASHRRLFREDDYVRHEIATALKRNIAVFPVLVRDARMPTAESLPPDIATLSFRNATEIRDTDFDHDCPAHRSPRAGLRRTPDAGAAASSSGIQSKYLLDNRGGCRAPRRCSCFPSVCDGGALSNHTGNTGASPQTPVYSQAPSEGPSEAPSQNAAPAVAEFSPVGSWTIQIENVGTGRFDLHEDNSYTAPNEQGTWEYSPTERLLKLNGYIYDPNTEATQPFNVQITIESGNGSQFFGRVYANGAVRRVWLTPL